MFVADWAFRVCDLHELFGLEAFLLHGERDNARTSHLVSLRTAPPTSSAATASA